MWICYIILYHFQQNRSHITLIYNLVIVIQQISPLFDSIQYCNINSILLWIYVVFQRQEKTWSWQNSNPVDSKSRRRHEQSHEITQPVKRWLHMCCFRSKILENACTKRIRISKIQNNFEYVIHRYKHNNNNKELSSFYLFEISLLRNFISHLLVFWIVVGFLDCLASLLMVVGGTGTPGPLQALLFQGVIPLTMFFSVIFLKERYLPTIVFIQFVFLMFYSTKTWCITTHTKRNKKESVWVCVWSVVLLCTVCL